MATAANTPPMTDAVLRYVQALEEPARRADAERLAQIIHEVTGEIGELWTASIVAFGRYRYQSRADEPGTGPAVAFGSGDPDLVLYLAGPDDRRQELLRALGPHTPGSGEIRFRRLSDVDEPTLRELIVDSAAAAGEIDAETTPDRQGSTSR